MNSASLELVNSAYTLAILDNGSYFIFKLNQCLRDTDPHADEALLQPHQVQHHIIQIDGVAIQHLSITVE